MLCYDPLESQLGKRAIVNLVYGAPIASCNFLIGGAYAPCSAACAMARDRALVMGSGAKPP